MLEYTGGHISRITDSTGRSITLTYDGDYLSQVDNPDGNSFSYTYEDGCLTEVSNLKGEVYVQNVYDSQGRVVHQEVANMVYSTSRMIRTTGSIPAQVQTATCWKSTTMSWDGLPGAQMRRGLPASPTMRKIR